MKYQFTGQKIEAYLTSHPESMIKQIAAGLSLGESTVRENLSKVQNLGKSDTKPFKYWIAVQGEVIDPPAAPAAPEPKSETQDLHCPLCKGDPSSQTPASAEGTFLGDSCLVCHDCGKTYNRFTKQEIQATSQKKANGSSKILNPQPKIDAIKKAFSEAGGSMTYKARAWAFALRGKELALTSEEFGGFRNAQDLFNKMGV